jgi:hypothetical protein
LGRAYIGSAGCGTRRSACAEAERVLLADADAMVGAELA